MLKIKKKDLEWASKEGHISTEQIDPLWSALKSRPVVKSKFDLINVIYYFGILLIIIGMGWFVDEAWETADGPTLFTLGVLYASIFSYIAHYLYNKKKLVIAGGTVATVAVCLVPLAILGFQMMTGLWPTRSAERYQNYYIWIKGSWIFLELGTIAAGLIMLRFIKFAFISAPIFLSLWFMSMDLTSLLFGKVDYSWRERKLASVIFGAILLLISYLWDRRAKLDYAFWGYLFGISAFWFALSPMTSNSELSMFIYFCVNLFFILISILFERKIFIIFGVLGCTRYLVYLIAEVFKDSLSFPIIICIIGLVIIAVGIKYQKDKEAIDKKLIEMLPQFLLDLSPARRVNNEE